MQITFELITKKKHDLSWFYFVHIFPSCYLLMQNNKIINSDDMTIIKLKNCKYIIEIKILVFVT